MVVVVVLVVVGSRVVEVGRGAVVVVGGAKGAPLNPGFQAAVHQLALDVRNLDSLYEQYRVFKEAREAAEENIRVQLVEFRVGGCWTAFDPHLVKFLERARVLEEGTWPRVASLSGLFLRLGAREVSLATHHASHAELSFRVRRVP